MGLFERFALKHSDEIISNLQNYGQHIKELGFNRSFTYIPNGISLEELENSESIDPDIKEIIPKNKFIVGYTGKFGISNALNILVAAAEQLKANPNIVFVLVGKGNLKMKLLKAVFI
jgi:hypothetical protein